MDVGQPRGEDVGYIWSIPFVPSWTSSSSHVIVSPEFRPSSGSKVETGQCIRPLDGGRRPLGSVETVQKRPATKQHHWIPGRKFSVDELSRISGQANVTISPTRDHSGPACIGPGLELPASVAMPVVASKEDPTDHSANSRRGRPMKTIASLFDASPRKPKASSHRLQAQHRHPPHAPHLNHNPTVDNETRPSRNGSNVGTPPPPYKLNSALPTSTPPTGSRRYHLAAKEPQQPQAAVPRLSIGAGTRLCSRQRRSIVFRVKLKHITTTPVALNRT